MYTDVKTKLGRVRVHHETLIVMYKLRNRKSWRWMALTQDIVAHRHPKRIRAVGHAAKKFPKIRVVR